MKNYVIVGNGVAAIGAVEGIRQHDAQGSITLVSEEDVPTYGRPLISYYLADKIKLDTLPYRDEQFYADNKVSLRLSSRVVEVKPETRNIILQNGEALEYDKLLLATGGTPKQPPIPGIEGDGVFNFTTLAHAEALKDVIERVSRVVVVGAGLIALKAAEGFAEKGIDVTVVVRSRLMRTYFDEASSDLITRHLEKNGMRFLQGASTEAIVRDTDGAVKGVKTDKGIVEADIVVIAAGVAPNMSLAQDAGIETSEGIRVDDHMRTSNEHVFAAGDVAEAKDLLTGEYTVRPIWPNAYTQGRYAGINMTGTEDSYSGGLSMNSITYYGLPTVSIGQTAEEDDVTVHVHLDKDRSQYRKLLFRENTLVGAILIGDIDAAGFYTSFIKNGFRLDDDGKRLLIDGDPSPSLWPDEYIEAMMNNP